MRALADCAIALLRECLADLALSGDVEAVREEHANSSPPGVEDAPPIEKPFSRVAKSDAGAP